VPDLPQQKRNYQGKHGDQGDPGHGLFQLSWMRQESEVRKDV
jgi:hypothetical protein